MKKFQSLLLSVLLSAFAFFIVHDYVIVDVDADTQYELCYASDSSENMDLPSQIHEHIHILQALPDTVSCPHGATASAFTFPLAEAMPLSPFSDVPQRPPLS